MKTILKGGKIITPDTTLENKSLIIMDRNIIGIQSGDIDPSPGDRVIDARGYWISPGLIDVHVHGTMGFDTMDATPEALHTMGSFFAKHGVTSYLPTTMTETPEAIMKSITNVANCVQSDEAAQHLGVHVEGPYFNPDHKGAQPEYNLRDADPSEYESWLDTGVVKLVSIAPERTGSIAFIDRGITGGVEFSVAHSGASYEQVIESANHGLRQATHTFNGMSGLHHRRPGTVGAVLTDDRIYAQVICDGVHVHPAVIDLIVRATGSHRTILITDAIRATGLADGDYELGGEKIIVKEGISRTAAGSLAGSTLTLDAAIRNMIAFTPLSFEEVLPMATSVPAKAMNWYGKKGVIRPGADADITIFDQKLNVRLTMAAGRIIFQEL
ncbi:N-acetylglucosamine-6-phosphate deacetylase [Chloroflexota bacterium]